MKKDIYVIRNTINNKCYVGQSVDYKVRFRKHKEEARRNNFHYKSVLYNAMNALGIDNFYVELLESQVENYNEREIYWINKLNTIRPNGYNLAKGGDWYPNLSGTLHHGATITSESDLDEIYWYLNNTDLSLTQIGDIFNVRYGVISDINSGKCYRRDGYKYPIRQFVLSKKKLDRLTFDLKYSNYSYQELSKIYDLSESQIKCINSGNSWKRDYVDYPIRRISFGCKRDKDITTKIKNDLISTNMSFEEIGLRYGCSVPTVRRINSGETYFDNTLKYPLRRTKKPLSQEQINEVCNYLANTDKSIKTISELTGIPRSTINYINSGNAKRYIDQNFTFPLRNKKPPVSTIHA